MQHLKQTQQPTTSMPSNALGNLLKNARLKKGWTQSQLAVKCGWLDSQQSAESNSRIANYERGNRTPRTDDLPVLAVVLSISPIALFKAIAEDAPPENDIHDINESGSAKWAYSSRSPGIVFTPRIRDALDELSINEDTTNEYIIDDEQSPFASISLYSNSALSAGPGVTLHDESAIEELAFRKDWLKKKGLSDANLVAVPCSGESMDPTIRNGEIVLIDTSDRALRDNKIYAINFGEEALLKRVFRDYDGGYILRSDNDIEADRKVPADDAELLRVIGRAVWHGGDL